MPCFISRGSATPVYDFKAALTSASLCQKQWWLRPSFSSHVRWCERGHPLLLRPRPVEKCRLEGEFCRELQQARSRGADDPAEVGILDLPVHRCWTVELSMIEGVERL